ncbi:MAG: response regulator [Planctomycetota bacterium]
MRILVAEDDFPSRVLVQRSLQPYGEVQVAVNGKQALAACERAIATGRPFDLLCLDIMMPEMDGLVVLDRVRALELEAGIEGLARCRVLMVTALGDSRHVITAFNSQCEAYLVKPFEKDDLLAKLAEMDLIPTPPSD